MKVGIMHGSLREFDLGEVLRVVGLGRQYTGVELRFLGGLAGTIFVKSGQVVSAQTDVAAGYDAFVHLFGGGDGEFYVYRSDTPKDLPEPIGPLNRLLFEVATKHASATQPPVPAVVPAAGAPDPTLTGVAPPAPGANVHHLGNGFEPVASGQRSGPAQVLPPAMPAGPDASASSLAVQGVSSSAAQAGKVVAVVSPKGGSGKSTLSLNLALSLAKRGYSVTLVDADVNGDMLSAVNARTRATRGALDLVTQFTEPSAADVEDLLLGTVLGRLKLLPAVGQALPDAEQLASVSVQRWRQLLGLLSARSQVVLIDTPAGMFGTTRNVVRASSHVLGVLQAEVLAARSFGRFAESLEQLTPAERPQVLGVVLNMLQTRHAASLTVFQDALQNLPRQWLLDTTIPRHPAFLDANHQGLPLRQLSQDAPPQVAFLFDNLAAELAERLGLPELGAQPQAFLL